MEGRKREVPKEKVRRMIPVLMRLWETPVPMPNTTVKTQAADGTILETIWESRWVPDSFKITPESVEDRTDMF